MTAITASLLDDGYLLEDEVTVAPDGAGIVRPATLLRVDPTAGHVIGIKVTTDRLVSTVTDLAATPLAIATVPRGHQSDPDAIGELFERAVTDVLEAARVSRERLLGIGIGVPGMVEPASGRVADSPLLEWAHLDLIGLLETRLGLPVLLDNDVNTLTVAEQLFGAGRGLAHLLVVSMAAASAWGWWSTDSSTGEPTAEPARSVRRGRPERPDCWCGRRGCLEAVAAEPAIIREVLATTGRLVQPDDIADTRRSPARWSPRSSSGPDDRSVGRSRTSPPSSTPNAS